MARWQLWILWTAATCFGHTLGAVVALLLPRQGDEVRVLLLGLLAALPQCFLLPLQGTRRLAWALGAATGWAMSYWLGAWRDADAAQGQITAGVLVGVLQAVVLHLRGRRAPVWIVVTAIALVVAFRIPSLRLGGLSYTPWTALIRFTSIGWINGAITGIPIALWFGAPPSRAEV